MHPLLFSINTSKPPLAMCLFRHVSVRDNRGLSGSIVCEIVCAQKLLRRAPRKCIPTVARILEICKVYVLPGIRSKACSADCRSIGVVRM